ncbi:MAG: hypothetical protein UX39_C0006G0023 [Candidatus Magasanikbacteria bacterium GW2011_GWA2_46_17]|uniref:Uncharacterized protein n=1 Tax=Candidatus Magasanikbacteria bacterium GW2011_GWA2_46_17 TaxID=1619042 RepID=A0A0G1P258_9BACT|nr:MAG: hypothetical protein UX39_C0006G0023 [Candidatus Magasanikbacteria bacterium GW2011_GWA2_46_17]
MFVGIKKSWVEILMVFCLIEMRYNTLYEY